MTMMDENAFWLLIDGSHSQAKFLSAALQSLSPEQIKSFELRFMELMNRAYRWDIWGAAYWLNGGCSDDSFMDFRGNLIRLGRKNFERILGDPNELAEFLQDDLLDEGFIYVPATVYRELTGKEMDFKDIWNQPDYPAQPTEPAGEDWDFDDRKEVAARLPQLFKRLPKGGA